MVNGRLRCWKRERLPLIVTGEVSSAPGGGNPRGQDTFASGQRVREASVVNNIIWIIGAVVVVLAVLSFFGLR